MSQAFTFVKDVTPQVDGVEVTDTVTAQYVYRVTCPKTAAWLDGQRPGEHPLDGMLLTNDPAVLTRLEAATGVSPIIGAESRKAPRSGLWYVRITTC